MPAKISNENCNFFTATKPEKNNALLTHVNYIFLPISTDFLNFATAANSRKVEIQLHAETLNNQITRARVRTVQALVSRAHTANTNGDPQQRPIILQFRPRITNLNREIRNKRK